MKLLDKVVVITGAASGIGAAMAERFALEEPRALVVADRDRERGEAVAQSVGGRFLETDVADEGAVARLVRAVEDRWGRVDLFCSNAGVGVRDPDPQNAASAGNELWARSWAVNVMAHVYAARALLPGMIVRGGGYFLNTISAAGLLSQIGSAPYSTTKHAAVGFAESLAITHRDHGIRVSIICPQAVDTPMLGAGDNPQSRDGVLSPAEVAQCVVEGVERETFLILPHPEVRTYVTRKAGDYDRWLSGMSRLRRSMI